MEDQTQDQKHERAADANVHSAELKAATATTARFVAAILDVGTISTGGPTHGLSSWPGLRDGNTWRELIERRGGKRGSAAQMKRAGMSRRKFVLG
jgi:hypothetical protein